MLFSDPFYVNHDEFNNNFAASQTYLKCLQVDNQEGFSFFPRWSVTLAVKNWKNLKVLREMADKPIEKIQGTLVAEETLPWSDASNFVLPLIKSHKWVNKARELVTKHPLKSSIISRRLGVTDFAVTYVVYESAKKTCKLVNQSDLRAWRLKEADIRSISLQNLRRMLEDNSRNTKQYFEETQAGLFYFDRLGNFSASVLLLHEVVAQIDIAEQDKVYQLPKSELLLVAKSTDAMATCFMGDVSLRFSRSKSFLGLQPLAYRNGWIPYKHSKVEHQFPVPLNKDEIKIYRKAIFR